MKKLGIKIIFDTLMTIVWIILMVYSVTGSLWHEVIGLAVFALFIIHIAYNGKKIAFEMPRMFTAGSGRITLRYLLVIFLAIGIVITGVSGILISKDILTGISTLYLDFWTVLHNWAAYITLALIGIHIGLHLKMIGGMFSYLLRAHPGLVTGLRRGWNGAAALLIVCGTIATVQYDLPSFKAASTDHSTSDPQNNNNSISPDNGPHIQYDDPADDLMTLSAQTGTGQITYTEMAASSDYAKAGSAAHISDTACSTPIEIAATPPRGDFSVGQSSYVLTASDETLEDYLGSLFCTICHKHCPLTALQCSRGNSELERATQEYYANHSDSSQDQQQDDQNPAQLPEDDPGLLDIIAIMGLYVGGTHYVSQISGTRKKRKSFMS